MPGYKPILAAMTVAAFALSACAEHVERSDKIRLDAGDAVAQNKVMQMIDPWPRHAERTHIHHDGQRANKVMKSYHERAARVEQSSSAAASPAAAPAAPAASPN